ncbi:integration host factor, actinobacterial type [Streptomyces sp. IB2014 016-6]|uniref:integration host factor, actinobacterial type n=1 Tax=Streptomyces sp. IB2014 016-6 TaxID=2517818 RepID=UPI0011CB97A3|nr:integration host factor, actinobacterial type [Streptomyces sp. IB2014 016-6]TXL84170.1 integration host factor [Streptomyces sp. IB2014 016-6]
MALPALTLSQRAAALEKAVAVRRERADLMAALKSGALSLSVLLAREDDIVGRLRVRRVLESLPGIGSIRAGQLLTDLEISEKRRIQGLGAKQRARLLTLFRTTD